MNQGTIKYFKLTLKHKWAVFRAGLRIGVPLKRLILHDMSKLSMTELPHYGRQFFGDKSDPKGFIECWVHHQNHNPHHWEYWIPRTGHNRCTPPYPDGEPIPMPEEYVREMVADWIGASETYERKKVDVNNWPWLEKNIHRMILHQETRGILNKVLEELGRNKEELTPTKDDL
jgi:hypothetical protein